MPLRLQTAGRTDIGLVRRSNQDCFGSEDEFSLFVVCDGMGGAAGGDVASQVAVEAFLSTARQELSSISTAAAQATSVALQRAVAAANRAVVSRAAWDTRYRGMGSTLVAVRLAGRTVTIVNVGDSRAYLVRAAKAVQMTEDHSFVAEQVRLGRMTAAEAEDSSLQSVITRAIGADADVRPDLYTATLEEGDVLLLTSDGLTRHVQQDELSGILAASAANSVDLACDQLVRLANERGGSDNITCVLVRVVEIG